MVASLLCFVLSLAHQIEEVPFAKTVLQQTLVFLISSSLRDSVAISRLFRSANQSLQYSHACFTKIFVGDVEAEPLYLLHLQTVNGPTESKVPHNFKAKQ